MRITKSKLRRIIREEKVKILKEQPQLIGATLWNEAIATWARFYEVEKEKTAGLSDYIAEKVLADYKERAEEELADWWVSQSGFFKDYPGDVDAMWEALRDPCEIVLQEAAYEFISMVESGEIR